MFTAPNILFILASFLLFVTLGEMEYTAEDSVFLFIFTALIYFMLIPKKSTFEDERNRNDTEDEYKEFLGKELIVNGFHCNVFKIKKSKDFEQNSLYVVYGKHKLTGEKRALPVNVKESSVKDFIEENKSNL